MYVTIKSLCQTSELLLTRCLLSNYLCSVGRRPQLQDLKITILDRPSSYFIVFINRHQAGPRMLLQHFHEWWSSWWQCDLVQPAARGIGLERRSYTASNFPPSRWLYDVWLFPHQSSAFIPMAAVSRATVKSSGCDLRDACGGFWRARLPSGHLANHSVAMGAKRYRTIKGGQPMVRHRRQGKFGGSRWWMWPTFEPFSAFRCISRFSECRLQLTVALFSGMVGETFFRI